MELKQWYKKVRFFTCPKTFFSWAGFGFPLHADDKEEDEEEEGEEEEKEDEEEDYEDEEQVEDDEEEKEDKEKRGSKVQ